MEKIYIPKNIFIRERGVKRQILVGGSEVDIDLFNSIVKSPNLVNPQDLPKVMETKMLVDDKGTTAVKQSSAFKTEVVTFDGGNADSNSVKKVDGGDSDKSDDEKVADAGHAEIVEIVSKSKDTESEEEVVEGKEEIVEEVKKPSKSSKKKGKSKK